MTLDKRALTFSILSVTAVVGIAFGVQYLTQPQSERYASAMARGYQTADADDTADESISADVINAGYKWAASEGIDRLSECDGRPAGFRKGCAEYLDDQNQGTILAKPFGASKLSPQGQ